MTRWAAVLATVLFAVGCADETARDLASAAEERANSAYARAEEAELRAVELEDRVKILEAQATY